MDFINRVKNRCCIYTRQIYSTLRPIVQKSSCWHHSGNQLRLRWKIATTPLRPFIQIVSDTRVAGVESSWTSGNGDDCHRRPTRSTEEDRSKRRQTKKLTRLIRGVQSDKCIPIEPGRPIRYTVVFDVFSCPIARSALSPPTLFSHRLLLSPFCI